MSEQVAYDRNKTFAVATGILCVLIFVAGTALGAYHSISELGVIAGSMSLACYLICDLGLIVASVVDYAEDDNPLEWAAWLVKGVLSIYLLFAGGCIAYVMLEKAEATQAQAGRVDSSQKAYNNCLAAAKTAKDKNRCNSLARTIQETEQANANTQKEARAAEAGWVGDYIRWPLFKYFPGILGALSIFGLTLAVKLNRWFEKKPAAKPAPAENGNWVPESLDVNGKPGK